ncbi:MAG TPA: GspE/PulE family protein [Gaiellaceae bacterium]|nr:GspE/PulE family protein [Gaiellaceae bacterium]
MEELSHVLQLQVAQGVRRRPLGTLLLDDGVITTRQLEEALAEAEQSGERLGEVLVRTGVLTRRMLAIALADQAGLEFVELGSVEADPAVAGLISERLARRAQVLPLRLADDSTVVVAVADPTDVLASDDLRLSLGLQLELVVAERDELSIMIERTYSHTTGPRLEILELEPGAEADVEDLEDASTSAPAIQLVHSILSSAIEDGASDIHFEPQAEEAVVRARIDGVMRKIAVVPRSLQAAVTSRLKVMGELDIAEKRVPQDGRVTVRYRGAPLDMRIAIMPTTYGEQVVLRVLQRRAGSFGLEDLGMSAENSATFERAIKQPYGAVIACGPTGSGKTTTLYAALGVLNQPDRVLMTIEDPVEYQMPDVAQIEVNVRAGLSFARGLRTILRSDPDVLLVGEIRDDETAHIAIQAAMTGHLVLTTLHTHNAASSIERLKDMGVEPSLLASTVNCIVAQRLARRLCLECREEYEPGYEELSQFGLEPDGRSLFRSRGCPHCAGTGYRGRVALYEVMPVHGQIRRLINSSTDEIFAAAVDEGMTTLRHDGLRLVYEGISTLDEIRRVTGDRII